MRILFSILSIVYIGSIFLLAGSPFISKIATFNIFSLLHIPLYGVLTVLLIFSIIPFKNSPNNQINQKNQTNRFLFAGLIALGIAVADEIHQAYIPGREASSTDVLLDFVGIALVLFFTFRLLKTKTSLIH